MDSQSDESSDNQAKKVANYRVRFRHGVFPSAEAQATRSDIKKYDYFFGSGQTWVDVQGNVDFVDESAQVAAEAKPAEQVKFIHSRRPSKRLIRTKTAQQLEQGSSVEGQRAPLRSIRPADNTSVPSAYVPLSTTNSGSWNKKLPYHRHASPATSSVSTSSLEGPSSLDWPIETSHSSPALPVAQTARVPCTLSDPLEAHLFRFWVDTVGPGWDLASPQKVFREVVPQMALKNRMLLDAILMISSQHIQRFDPACSGKPFLYYDRVLQQLIPCLAGIGNVTDEATLVTAIFLRGFEELHAGTQGQHYLSTFELFQGKSGWLFNMNSPVVQACFMIHVRFEIFGALLNEQSLQVDYRNAPPPMVTAPIDDVCWTNRIVWLSGRILQWLTHENHTFEEWQLLKNEVTEWEHNRPQSFDAFFYRESSSASEKDYPELWFSNACHVDAHQHLGICRVALAMSYDELRGRDNRIHDIEPTGDTEVAQWLKEIIGVAKCNPSPASASKLAAHITHKFAGGLQGRSDQRSIMEFLKEVDNSGWRTIATQHWLASEWGWHLHNQL